MPARSSSVSYPRFGPDPKGRASEALAHWEPRYRPFVIGKRAWQEPARTASIFCIPPVKGLRGGLAGFHEWPYAVFG